jgi:hypothetical protein
MTEVELHDFMLNYWRHVKWHSSVRNHQTTCSRVGSFRQCKTLMLQLIMIQSHVEMLNLDIRVGVGPDVKAAFLAQGT